jgi:hypothetical protein
MFLCPEKFAEPKSKDLAEMSKRQVVPPGFIFSMSAIFLARDQPFNCFSRAIALTMSGNVS